MTNPTKNYPRFMFDFKCIACHSLLLPALIHDAAAVSIDDVFICFGCQKINVVNSLYRDKNWTEFRSITEPEYIALVSDETKWDLVLTTKNFIMNAKADMPPVLRKMIDYKFTSI